MDENEPAFPVEETVADTDSQAAAQEEVPRVKYSRFEKYVRQSQEAEARAEAAEARLAALERERRPSVQTDYGAEQPPSWWLENYGDTPQARKAWQNQYQHEQELQSRLIEQAEERAITRIREEQQNESSRLESNIGVIDENLESLSDMVGRDLTEGEQSEVLDIVDEFTPKDRSGNYLGAILPFDKAWEVYEMRHQNQNAKRRDSRDQVASLNGASTNGQPTSSQAEADKNFVPGRWSSWRDKLKN